MLCVAGGLVFLGELCFITNDEGVTGLMLAAYGGQGGDRHATSWVWDINSC